MVAPPLKTKKRRIVQRVSTLNRKAKNNRQGGREAEKFSNPSRTRGGVLRGARFARPLSNGVAAAAAVASTCLFAVWLLLRLGVACRAAHRRSALHGTGRTPLSHRLAALVTATPLQLSRTITITGAAAAAGSAVRLVFFFSLGLGWAGQAGLQGWSLISTGADSSHRRRPPGRRRRRKGGGTTRAGLVSFFLFDNAILLTKAKVELLVHNTYCAHAMRRLPLPLQHDGDGQSAMLERYYNTRTSGIVRIRNVGRSGGCSVRKNNTPSPPLSSS